VSHALDDLVDRQHRGEAVGITSVCSAHPWVLRAAACQARDDGSTLLVEATSNQVDQFGGYTGMRPADFVALVHRVADDHGLARAAVVLGGDHLGPNTWRGLPAAEAMDRADDLVAAYVAAGFTKIHLDCSYACADDVAPLGDDVVAERSARMLRVALDAAPEPGALRFVIGTEVPVPGGADHAITTLTPTSAAAARATLDAHRAAFAAAGVEHAWPQVMALVVQPGVEFDHLRVHEYDRTATAELRHVVDTEPHLVFEAHSTDYQTEVRLAELVEDHWAVLKVGPGLTFALREALFALAAIEADTVPAGERSDLREVVEARMTAEPDRWNRYYTGSETEQRIARTYSYSDRMRYYWTDPEIAAAVDVLVANLRATGIALPLVSAHLPEQYVHVRDGVVSTDPVDLVVDRVRDVLRTYAVACGTRRRVDA
jgi:D-tagatose-1,6-bisphosphate aldolase subunit GatZ/KbaZ